MQMSGIFARHGLLSKIVSENGSQFVNTDFAQFAKTRGVINSTSDP